MSHDRYKQSPKRTILHQTDFFEVVSIEWTNESISLLHDHGWSLCSVLVEEGIFEESLNLGMKTELRVFEVGQVLHTPLGAKHEIRCLSPHGRTLHFYAPKVGPIDSNERFSVGKIDLLKMDLRLSEPTRLDHLQRIMKSMREQSVTTHSPYFMNQLFSGIAPQTLLGEELINQTKTTLATYEASSVFSTVEAEVVEALGEKIGWPHGHREGVSVPGGSAANFMALHCARQKMFPEIKKAGMTGQKLKIFVSAGAHYSFKKGSAAMGFGTDSVVSVPCDDKGRMKSADLDFMIEQSLRSGEVPFFVCATVGTTVRGAFDPIGDLAAICNKYGLWLHVDAAWGGPALFSDKMKNSIRGTELADSVTFDAHKLFGASLTCSFFLTKHRQLLLEANDVTGGDYLFHSDEEMIDRGRLSWQCGRKADALSFWTIWKSLGTDGLGSFVDRLLGIRDEALLWIKSQERLVLVYEPEYLNICVRVVPRSTDVDPAGWSVEVREDLKIKNLAMVNYASDENGSFLRLVLAHPFLEFKHIRQILEWALEVDG